MRAEITLLKLVCNSSSLRSLKESASETGRSATDAKLVIYEQQRNRNPNIVDVEAHI
jgi:hypothetical protein